MIFSLKLYRITSIDVLISLMSGMETMSSCNDKDTITTKQ